MKLFALSFDQYDFFGWDLSEIQFLHKTVAAYVFMHLIVLQY